MLNPALSTDDQQQLAQCLEISVDELKQQYLEYDKSDGESKWRIKKTPCPFLENNKCTVYDSRPANCRDYPYLYKPDFTYRLIGMVERTFTCSIVYNVMEKLKEKLHYQKGSRSRGPKYI